MSQFSELRGRGLSFLLLAGFLWFMSFTSRTIFAPLLPFIEDEFAITHARASSIFFLSSVGYTTAVFLGGVFGRLLGKKGCMITSLVVAAVACFTIPLFPVFRLFYVATFSIGLAAGFYLPAAIPLLTSYYDEKIWGRVLAIHDTGSGFSLSAAPIIATALLTLVPWRGVFVVVGTMLLVSAVVFGLVAQEKKGVVRENRSTGGRLWHRGDLWFSCIVTSFMSGAAIGLYYIVPLYLTKELAMPAAEANTMLGLSRIASIAVVIGTGFFVDRFSLKKTLFFLALSSGLATMLLTTKDMTWITVLLVIQPCLLMAFIPAQFLAISRLFEEESRGRAMAALLASGTIVGTGIIPYLLGVAGDLASFRLGIFILGLATSLSSSLVLLLRGLK